MRFSITSLIVIGAYLISTAAAAEATPAQAGTSALDKRQGCPNGFGWCSSTGVCCPRGGECCRNATNAGLATRVCPGVALTARFAAERPQMFPSSRHWDFSVLEGIVQQNL
ncbi:hypothetical protein P691DRAFT_784640 [Macrolepiota fuliginosa MF-IS2]|uniref:Granulins domain-containing protein n=1 Tax=Macrolepiota fuliginosa MF-IS2 TaxID=1400762 RepID=A0A9P5X6R0_9AGAR|nr:hypothetical protein P691DRAFT_784640 [Macrolepiota fuliginosa MF-IS2]